VVAARKGGQVATQTDKYAAGEQGLGYVYQIRFALAYLMKQDESQALLIEADDDVELRDVYGKKMLISLKHSRHAVDRLLEVGSYLAQPVHPRWQPRL
jgi:hypothetical protein